MNIDAAVIREHSPALFSFALRKLHRREDAEDLVQETWISALSSVSSFEGRASLRTWLTKILRRRIADRYRRTRSFAELVAEQVASEQTAPEARVDAREQAALVELSCAQLTQLERRALLLDLQDVDRDEAAESLGVTRGHLRVLLFRAREKLSSSLEQANAARAGEVR